MTVAPSARRGRRMILRVALGSATCALLALIQWQKGGILGAALAGVLATAWVVVGAWTLAARGARR